MDVTDIVDYNLETINRHDLDHSFFYTSRDDLTEGFDFDATIHAGHTYPKDAVSNLSEDGTFNEKDLRLKLGSHFAMFVRHQLEQHKGYSSTVGIATNKLLSKLIGNLNKPKGQTTLRPIDSIDGNSSSVIDFMDAHEIGKVPGIGFKLAQKLRELVLQRATDRDPGYSGIKEHVTVSQVRIHPDIDYGKLEKLLGGPGSPHGIGYKVWCLLHGIDDSEVSQARSVPRQISIEDSYIRLDTMPELLKELNVLARSLLKRMRIDLLCDTDDFGGSSDDTAGDDNHASKSSLAGKRWLAHPKTLRLTTRPRMPMQVDGTRMRTMKRISHSCPLPNFVFGLHESVDALAEKLVRESLLSMFRKLHPEKLWWNLSLVNLAVTNMAEAAGESRTANGRNIGNMFKRQEDVLKDYRVTEADDAVPSNAVVDGVYDTTRENVVVGPMPENEDEDSGWVEDDSIGAATDYCHTCGSSIPPFAMIAHQRFHAPAIR